MLVLPDGPNIYRILSIDPGTDTLGVSVLDLDLITFEASVTYVTTLKASKRLKYFVEVEESRGSRKAKLHANSIHLTEILLYFKPNTIISESPYLGKFPTAFEALIQCMEMIQGCIDNYDRSLVLETIDPPNVKKAVGAPGRGGGKDIVKRAVLGLTKLKNSSGNDLRNCDEHSIDAIAVGCYKLNTIDTRILF